jgi:hypothetical protein
LTDGTVTGGALATESLPTLEAVLEAVLDAEGVVAVTGVDEAPGPTPWMEAVERDPAGGMALTPGAERPSLLAAQARMLMRANETSTGIDDDL